MTSMNEHSTTFEREIRNMSDAELRGRYESGMFADWACADARAELDRRGVAYGAVADEGSFAVTQPFRKKHPVIFWLFVIIAVNLGLRLVRALF